MINTSNDKLVGAQGDWVVVGLPFRTARMTKEEALRHAAWLVAIAEEKDGEFDTILAAIKNT